MSYPGATYLGGCRVLFRVWAPHCRSVAVRTLDAPTRAPVTLAAAGGGWFEAIAGGIEPGARYTYLLNEMRE